MAVDEVRFMFVALTGDEKEPKIFSFPTLREARAFCRYCDMDPMPRIEKVRMPLFRRGVARSEFSPPSP